MRFVFVAKHRGIWPIGLTCDALDVSRGGFYAWLSLEPGRRTREDRRIRAQARDSFIASDRTYGARRVWRDVLALGTQCGLHRIERLMRLQGLRARPRGRGLPADRGQRIDASVGQNILARQFAASVAEPTMGRRLHVPVVRAEGWLYVAVVLDLFSRSAVGWSMTSSMTTQLVTDALMRKRPHSLMHHSDRGSQNTSHAFQRLLQEQGITCSMSRAGEVWDNSAMESFFSSLKTKRTSRIYRTRDEARADVFDYIETFCNSKRRHSTLGYLSPIQYEEQSRYRR